MSAVTALCRDDERCGNAASPSDDARPAPFVSVVLPVWNEAAVLSTLVERLHAALADVCRDYELLFVDDGSTDGSGVLLDRLAAVDPQVAVLHLTRNFGHQAAVQAGLEAARGDAIVVMDTDLQDDPRALPEFLRLWRAGYDVVYAVRIKRKERWLKRLLFAAFYRLLQAAVSTPLPLDAGNFGLIDRRVARELNSLPERARYFPGLRHWVGLRQIGVPVERLSRHDDTPRVTWWGLFRLAKTAVFSFSTLPLTIFYAVALISLFVCGGLTTLTLYAKWHGTATPGWTSGLMTASFFGTLNAFGIAILGEYVVRIFDQVRARPLYIVDRAVNMQRSAAPWDEVARPAEFARAGVCSDVR